ncbi:MAG: type I glyceraldehyde-3-phosphate dehydrogenase [Candidatus Thorarchaeota archaeon]|nr:type I glyceraldehyde-3-phosphate dehydrogenase [Candidatus Thorarchaeota archaeon]
MTVRVGINGFGRIGRITMRAALKQSGYDIVAVNDLSDAATLGHLLKYDTVMGEFDGTVEIQDNGFLVNGKDVKVLSERDPAKLPWKDLGVDIVIECTGFFRKREDAEKHIQAGAKKVILSAPGKSEMFTTVLGVNEKEYDPDKHHVISNASCTTNCLAPMVKVLDEGFGIESGLMTTIHSVTNDQRILDMQHRDIRRARAATWNIVPTTTGATKAIGLVYPNAAGKLNGMAFRVPVMDVSIVDLVVNLEKKASKDEVNGAFKKAAEGDLKGYLKYTELPLVSSDYIGDPHSCIFDSLLTYTQSGMVKVMGWYDNEAGYSARLADLAALVAKKL